MNSRETEYVSWKGPMGQQVEEKRERKASVSKSGSGGYGMGMDGALTLLVWGVIIFFIVGAILWLLKPSFVLKTGTQDPDIGKIALWAILFTVFLLILIWLVKYLSRNSGW